MTPALRTARCLTLGALSCTAGAVYLGAALTPWMAAPGLYVATFLAWCAHREYAHHARLLARHRLALHDAVLLGELPCCRLAEHSAGRAHGTDCLRPPDPDEQLAAACCAEGFVSRGARHEPACHLNSQRSSAA